MSVLRILGLVACWVAFVILGLRSTFAWFKVVEEVNKKLPNDEHFSQIWWHPAKYSDVRANYKQLYPEGTLLHTIRRYNVVGFVVAAIAAILVFL